MRLSGEAGNLGHIDTSYVISILALKSHHVGYLTAWVFFSNFTPGWNVVDR
jgi:hypothetical protein